MPKEKWLTTSSGLRMPPIIYGTAWKKERTADLVVKAVEAGFRGIDTACQPKHYDEALVGAGLKRLEEQGVKRSSLFVQTKFTPLAGQDPSHVPYDREAPIELQAAQSFETSKKNLQTEYVDALMLHSPLAPHSVLMKVWNSMEGIQKAGGAQHLGISNCYDTEILQSLHADAEVKPAIVQNRFYRETGYDKELRRWCSDHSVIYQSFWTLTANPHILVSNTVQAIRAKHNKTAPQIFFRYLIQTGVAPLTGTTSEHHMREDLDIFDFELSSEDVEDISLLLN